MKSFQEFIDSTCDDIDMFVGVNKMSHRDFGKWTYECLGKELEEKDSRIEQLKEMLRKAPSCDFCLSKNSDYVSAYVANCLSCYKMDLYQFNEELLK